MTYHSRLRKGQVACQRCRRVVESSTPEEKRMREDPEEKRMREDLVALAEAMLYSLATALLVCRDTSGNSDARLIELRQITVRSLTADQRLALLLTIKHLDHALAESPEDLRGDSLS